ncbi:hypothetical protein ACTXT7_015043 [Hymenolepis weldensis]
MVLLSQVEIVVTFVEHPEQRGDSHFFLRATLPFDFRRHCKSGHTTSFNCKSFCLLALCPDGQ